MESAFLRCVFRILTQVIITDFRRKYFRYAGKYDARVAFEFAVYLNADGCCSAVALRYSGHGRVNWCAARISRGDVGGAGIADTGALAALLAFTAVSAALPAWQFPAESGNFSLLLETLHA